MIRNFIEKLDNVELVMDANLKRYNTYRLEVVAKYLVFPNNKEDFRDILEFVVKNKIKHVVLGNGSNVIFRNDYYDGVVILLNKLNKMKIDDDMVVVDAGYSLQKLAMEVSNMGLEGLEFATGIPGLVGASIAMNAGAYKKELSEVVESVLVINPDFEFVVMDNKKLNFEYRSSMFKKKNGYYIVSAKIKLLKGDKAFLLEKISKRRVKRIETQPLDMPSAGAVFRNPGNDMYAGEMIEKCGFKGYSVNDAKVSEKHANFIVNNGKAKGADIIKLVDKIKCKVKEEYGVDLVMEQIIID